MYLLYLCFSIDADISTVNTDFHICEFENGWTPIIHEPKVGMRRAVRDVANSDRYTVKIITAEVLTCVTLFCPVF